MVQNLASVGRVRDPINSQFRAQLLDELRRRTNTQIGGDKGGLEVIPGVIVELVSAQQLGQTTSKRIVAVSQTTPQSGHPRAWRLGRLDRWFSDL